MSYLDVYRRQIEYLQRLEGLEAARLSGASKATERAIEAERESRKRLAEIREALEITRTEYERELGGE